MRRVSRRLPTFDLLEAKQLLSAIHFDHVILRGHVAAPSVPVVLDGSLAGTSNSVISSTTGPETLRMGFSGLAGSMGQVTAVFTQRIAFATARIVNGSVVLKNARGSVTLGFNANGVIQNTYAPSGNTTVVAASIVSSTGAFAHASGGVTVTVNDQPGNRQLHLTQQSPTA
jgi:hypothetical protein